MRISSKEDTPSRTYTIFIFANSTFPPENQIKEFIPSSASSGNSNSGIPQQSEEKSQNVIGISSMLVTVLDPLTLPDKISEFWSKVGNPLQFFYGVLAGLSPWVYKELKNKIKKDKD